MWYYITLKHKVSRLLTSMIKTQNIVKKMIKTQKLSLIKCLKIYMYHVDLEGWLRKIRL